MFRQCDLFTLRVITRATFGLLFLYEILTVLLLFFYHNTYFSIVEFVEKHDVCFYLDLVCVKLRVALPFTIYVLICDVVLVNVGFVLCCDGAHCSLGFRLCIVDVSGKVFPIGRSGSGDVLSFPGASTCHILSLFCCVVLP